MITISMVLEEGSKYSRYFNESENYNSNDPAYNLCFLKSICQYENDKLKKDGYLFLNDVLVDLGLSRVKEGQVIGWIYDRENSIGVDFGVSKISPKDKKILLNFNADGVIIDKINFNNKKED